MVLGGFHRDLKGFWKISGGSGGGEALASGGFPAPLGKEVNVGKEVEEGRRLRKQRLLGLASLGGCGPTVPALRGPLARG